MAASERRRPQRERDARGRCSRRCSFPFPRKKPTTQDEDAHVRVAALRCVRCERGRWRRTEPCEPVFLLLEVEETFFVVLWSGHLQPCAKSQQGERGDERRTLRSASSTARARKETPRWLSLACASQRRRRGDVTHAVACANPTVVAARSALPGGARTREFLLLLSLETPTTLLPCAQ